MVIGIDATNLRRGGGVTHLVELLAAAEPAQHGIDRIVIWGGSKTLAAIADRPWLEKVQPVEMDRSVLQRTWWQWRRLSIEAESAGCDVLFVPGGSFAGDFHPVVTMSQNLLPFDLRELKRYGWSLVTLKLLLLRFTQSRSFKKSDGVVFLTEGALDKVVRVTGKLHGKSCVVHHGMNPRFTRHPKIQRPITEYDNTSPYRILYVSIIDQYKHQWYVVEAVSLLRQQGFPVTLDLVGPAYPPALKKLDSVIAHLDPERRWVRYHGAVPYQDMAELYAAADMGIWASTCETFGIILLESMAAGLPIACSHHSPMPEVLGGAGIYFDPEQPCDIARALHEILVSSQLRTELAYASYERAQQFSWQRCADETFSFLSSSVER